MNNYIYSTQILARSRQPLPVTNFFNRRGGGNVFSIDYDLRQEKVHYNSLERFCTY